ncbi:hypothetical protein [Eremococcus coleocola]|uniref:hypothetical protein n=1 Tax=Eremococcus coleocola TaxID=88132 RepID=UPI00041511B5|nr:hypothetical protein [Eremococcus coleocola]
MESPIKYNFIVHLNQEKNKLVNKLMDTFNLAEFRAPLSTTIMPVTQVEQTLNQHYVSLDPIYIEFEYYNHQNKIQEDYRVVQVLAPINHERHVQLLDCQTHQQFSLSLQQILTVSAKAA